MEKEQGEEHEEQEEQEEIAKNQERNEEWAKVVCVPELSFFLSFFLLFLRHFCFHVRVLPFSFFASSAAIPPHMYRRHSARSLLAMNACLSQPAMTDGSPVTLTVCRLCPAHRARDPAGTAACMHASAPRAIPPRAAGPPRTNSLSLSLSLSHPPAAAAVVLEKVAGRIIIHSTGVVLGAEPTTGRGRGT